MRKTAPPSVQNEISNISEVQPQVIYLILDLIWKSSLGKLLWNLIPASL